MILSQSLKRQFKTEAEKSGIEIEMSIKNITINGQKRGCSGHIVNPANGSCVYLITEPSCLSSLVGKSMYRLAENTKDWSSNGLINGNNRWCPDKELAAEVIHLLASEVPKKRGA